MKSFTNYLTVGINSFVLRQTKDDFAGTKVNQSQLENLRKASEKAINANGSNVKSPEDYLRIVTLKDPSIISKIAKITPENEKLLKKEMTRRRAEEEEYEHRFFDSSDVKGIPSHHVDVILYSKEQLKAEQEKMPSSDFTGADFDIVSVNAEPYEESAPMAPSTMLRNIKGKEAGGSGRQHSPEELAKAEEFWNNHANIK